LKQEHGEDVVVEVELPSAAGTAMSEIKLALGMSKTADGTVVSHVWLHNTSTKKLVMPVGTYLGQGGPGSFVNLVNSTVEPAKVAFSWRFTRLTGHKRDNAELANGYMVLNKDGAPLPQNSKPKLSCLSDIETELGNNVTVWGHAITRGGTKVTMVPSPSPIAWVPASPAVGGNSEGGEDGSGSQKRVFGAATLGQFLRSHEDVSGLPKCTGLMRPIFEIKTVTQNSGGRAAYSIQPGASPGLSPLWLFASKKIELGAGAFVALG
jgi:hypothetical protein